MIAGDIDGHAGPGSTYTPITMIHATISPGARLELPWRNDFNSLAYVLAGNGTAGVDGRPIRKGQLALFGDGDTITLGAGTSQPLAEPNLEVLLLGGRPIREPVVQYGPFVMNTREEVVRAFEDYQAGRFGVIPAEHLPHTN